VDGLLHAVADLARRTIGESITVETVFDTDIWPLHVDPAQVESAILNLAINARDAMPSGGRLVIKAINARTRTAEKRLLGLMPGDYVAISVSDTGTGMTAEVQEHAFEPFYSTKEVGKGTGLGLSQVYGFARQTGGTAAIKSVPGEGTTVLLYLPRATRLADEHVSLLGQTPPRPTERKRVLLVEDEAEVRESIEAMLIDLGHLVLAAADGAAARQVLESSDEIDLLVTDAVMPHGVTGLDLVRDAQQIRPGLKTVLISGYLREAHDGPPKPPGLIFLEKPFLLAQLADAIASAFGTEAEAQPKTE
jgi:CheY-like chemotaxis protein